MIEPFATLLADRDDEAYLVYANWLIARGDPRNEETAAAFRHLRTLRVAEIDGTAAFADRCSRALPCLEVRSDRDP
jgi:hypothetical protein